MKECIDALSPEDEETRLLKQMYTYCKKKMESTLLKEYRDLLKQHKAFPNDLWKSCEISSITNAMEEYLSKDGCMEVRTQLESICHREIEAMLLEQNAVRTLKADVSSFLKEDLTALIEFTSYLRSTIQVVGTHVPSFQTQCFASLHLCFSAFHSCITHASFFTVSERFLQQWTPQNATAPPKDLDDALEETLSISTAFTVSARSLGFTDLSIPHLASLQTAITRLRLVALFADASELSLPLVEDVIYLLQSSVQRERVTGCDTHCVEQVTQVLFPAFETAFRSLESASDHAWLVVSEKTLTLLDCVCTVRQYSEGSSIAERCEVGMGGIWKLVAAGDGDERDSAPDRGDSARADAHG
ncbi:hypothetical protein WA538_001326, partial [Blastocystis sp. DL]